VWSGAPRTYTDVSNYTEVILDVVDTRANKLVFRGTGMAVIGGPESNAGKIRDAVKKMVAALASAATR
jgi:TATA-box binding protein (TBP) (component of TFIID and TFIIIB)